MLHRWTALQHVQSMKFELIQLGKCIPSPQHIGEPVVNTQNIGQLVYEIQLLLAVFLMFGKILIRTHSGAEVNSEPALLNFNKIHTIAGL